MHVLEQVQRRGAAAVEELHVVGFGQQRVRDADGVDEGIELGDAGRAECHLRAQRVAQHGQVLAQIHVRVVEQARQHAQRMGHAWRSVEHAHRQISALIGMVRRFSVPNRLVSDVPSEHPLPNEKPQPPRTLNVFSAYSRCVLGMTKRSS